MRGRVEGFGRFEGWGVLLELLILQMEWRMTWYTLRKGSVDGVSLGVTGDTYELAHDMKYDEIEFARWASSRDEQSHIRINS